MKRSVRQIRWLGSLKVRYNVWLCFVKIVELYMYVYLLKLQFDGCACVCLILGCFIKDSLCSVLSLFENVNSFVWLCVYT